MIRGAASLVAAIFSCIAAADPPVAAPSLEVYKCTSDGGRVLYTSEPCDHGEILELQAGTADAAAIDKLRHDVERDGQRAMQRRAAEARDAELRRLEWERWRRDEEDARQAALAAQYAGSDDDYGYFFGLLIVRPERPRAPRPPRPPKPSLVSQVPAQIRPR